MDPATQSSAITALAAVAGSIVGGLASFLTTYFTQRHQAHRDLMLREAAHREELYSQFIKEAANVYVDSLDKTLEKPASLLGVYSLVGRIRLVSNDTVLAAAEKVVDSKDGPGCGEKPSHTKTERRGNMYSQSRINRTALAFVVAVSLLGGCSNLERTVSTTVPPYASLPNGRDPVNPDHLSALGKRFSKGLIPTLQHQHVRPLNVLEISGGGPNGAFGSGVLVGWAESGTRPKFDIVTGISAGALLSTFAFLGEPEDDAIISELFTGMKKDDVSPKAGGVLRFVFGDNSLMDNKPLAETLRKLITEKTLDRVAAEARKGRFLFVGLVNLDYRQLWAFDLTGLAASGEADALDTYRKILLASASPPLIFPPVEIKGSLFADGGIRDRLLVAGFDRGEEGASSAATSGGGTFYVIFNDKAESKAKAITPDIKGVISSTIQTMMDANMETTLLGAYAMAQVHGFQFKLMKIPDSVELGADPFVFDPEIMKVLFEKGRALGRSPSSWVAAPSAGQYASPWLIQVLSELRRQR